MFVGEPSDLVGGAISADAESLVRWRLGEQPVQLFNLCRVGSDVVVQYFIQDLELGEDMQLGCSPDGTQLVW